MPGERARIVAQGRSRDDGSTATLVIIYEEGGSGSIHSLARPGDAEQGRHDRRSRVDPGAGPVTTADYRPTGVDPTGIDFCPYRGTTGVQRMTGIPPKVQGWSCAACGTGWAISSVNPRPYLDQLAMAVELAAAQPVLRKIITLADQAYGLIDDQLRFGLRACCPHCWSHMLSLITGSKPVTKPRCVMATSDNYSDELPELPDPPQNHYGPPSGGGDDRGPGARGAMILLAGVIVLVIVLLVLFL